MHVRLGTRIKWEFRRVLNDNNNDDANTSSNVIVGLNALDVRKNETDAGCHGDHNQNNLTVHHHDSHSQHHRQNLLTNHSTLPHCHFSDVNFANLSATG